jgi:hypothetical protein
MDGYEVKSNLCPEVASRGLGNPGKHYMMMEAACPSEILFLSTVQRDIIA